MSQFTLALPVTIPSFENLWFVSSKSSEACNNAFEGIHPIFKHVPPNVSLLSTQAVFRPSWAHLIAQTYPPGPEPIIITS